MPTEVEVAGEGIFEFPDGMGDDEIQSILRKQFPVQESPQAKQFRRDELAKQTFEARLEGEQAKALTGLTDIGTEAAKAVVRAASHVDPTGFTQGLMQQYGVEPTHVIPPEVAHRGGEIVSEAAGAGLRKLGITHDIVPKQVQRPIMEFAAENVAALPEMLPALITGATAAPRPIGRLFQAQMLRGVPESAYVAATAETPEERLKAGLGAGMGLAFPALIERGMRQPSVPIPDFVGRQLGMQRGAIPPRGEPVAPIERVTPEQAAVAAERMSAPFEGESVPTKTVDLQYESGPEIRIVELGNGIAKEVDTKTGEINYQDSRGNLIDKSEAEKILGRKLPTVETLKLEEPSILAPEKTDVTPTVTEPAKPEIVPTQKLSNKTIASIWNKLVETSRDDVTELLVNWQDARLSEDGTKIIGSVGREREVKTNPSKKSFLEWLNSDKPLDPKEYDLNPEWVSLVERTREKTKLSPKPEVVQTEVPPAETPVEGENRLAELTAKVESGQKLTASEKKQYLKLRDEATKKEPEAAQAQVSVGPGAAAPLDIAAESAAQSAGIRTAEYINRGLETKDIPTQPDIAVPEADLKSADPQVEARWRAARLSKASPLEKAKQAIAASKNAMTRHFRFLDPKTDGVVTDILRVHENDPLHAKFMASQVMRGITEGLKPKKYDVFSRIVILRDLVKYGEQFGQDLENLPFGYKSWDAVKNDLGRFEALAEKYPDIKESLRRRDEFMGALRYDLVSRGLLSEKVKDFDEYFHHQVLQYMALKEPYASTGSMDVRTHGKGWQKGRTGSAKDYNTSYLESEFEVISQSFAQMATQDTLKQLKAASDIADQLKIAAKDARDSGSDITWEQLIPDDYTIWQPQQGNHFYWANSITEKALDAYLRGQKQLTEADIKEVLAMGGPKEQWVIPKRLAKTLDDFKPPVDHAVEKAIGAGISQWKRWTLFNPMRNVIYELNNLSGDADIAFAVDPKIFKHAPQAAKEVAQFVRAKKGASKEMSDLVRLGVIDSGFSVQELPDLKGNQFFRALEGRSPSITQRYWENVLDFNRWREGVLRLASYKRAMELLESGKRPYWTSKKSEMDALYKDPNVTREQVAAKLAREAIGDYGNISYAGQWIRSKLIPFYSWMEINAPRYVRLLQNEGSAARVAGVAGKKAITQSAKLATRMSAFYFLANLWNRSMFPEEDKELNSTRDQFHVILHRNEDGSITSLRLQGAFSDALSWFGAQDLIKDVKDVQGGMMTPQEKAAEMAKAPVNKIAQGAWPIYKTLFEALVKKQTYPDVFNPRPIRDSKAHIARMVSLGSIYDYLAKHPQRPGTWTLKALATYTTDPGEAAYMTAKSIVADKLKEMNVERPGTEPTAKSNALYYWKQSIRYKNPKLEEYWRNEYQRLGGKTQYLDTGLRNTSPYNGVSKANRGKFESLLTPAEQEIMRRADGWYRKTYIER